MTTKNDGGPAFPQIDTETVGSQGEYQERVYSYGGMTLRDYFAAKAMQTIHAEALTIMRTQNYKPGPEWQVVMARNAYSFADAMLEARVADNA